MRFSQDGYIRKCVMSVSVLLFQNLDLDIALVHDKPVIINVYAKFSKTIPKGSRDRASVTVFRI